MNNKQILFLIFVIALILRIGFIIFYEHGKMLQNEYYADDEYSYDQIATNFLKGGGFVTDDGYYARRAPVYPLFLATIYFIFGHSFVAARFTQAIIGALSCIIIYLIAKELFEGNSGLIAAFITAVYYPFILQPAYLLTEVLFTFNLALSIFFFLRYYARKRIFLLFAASIIFGIASLCRAVIFPFALFISAWLFIVYWPGKKIAIKASAIFCLAIIIMVLPWTLRNFRIYHAFIPITIESGRLLYLGNNPRAIGGIGGWVRNDVDLFYPMDISNPHSLEADRIMLKRALHFMAKNPERTIFLMGKKFINMWRPYYVDAKRISKVAMGLPYIVIIILGILGIVLGFKAWPKTLFLCAIIVYVALIHMVTIAEIRYRYPVMPFLIIFASHALVRLSERRTNFQK